MVQRVLKQFIDNSIDSLYKKANLLSEHHAFHIDCSLLVQNQYLIWEERRNNKCSFFKMFEKLDTITNPCLYWFETSCKILTSDLISELDKHRIRHEKVMAPHKRVVPVRNVNIDSQVLYVGKRKGGITKKSGVSHICGRVFIHLGYYEHGSTQGLQLNRWSFTEKLILNIIVLPKESEIYLDIFEKLLAMELKPMCGKH